MSKRSSISVRQVVKLSVYGKDFKRARYTANLSLWKISQFMRLKGYVYYPMLLHRLEKQESFTLELTEMLDLLDCIETDLKIL